MILGKVSIVSQSGDDIYGVSSVGGMEFSISAIEVMQINTCLYLSRGLAEYLFIASSNEFFVPQGDNWNFMDVFKSTTPKINVEIKNEKTMDVWRKKKKTDSTSDDSHGWAQQHAHPYCYITVASSSVYKGTSIDFDDVMNPWLGQRYQCRMHVYPLLVNHDDDFTLPLPNIRI